MDNTYIYIDEAGEWRWRRIAPNGQCVGASTEGYKDRQDCIANLIRMNGVGHIFRGDEVEELGHA